MSNATETTTTTAEIFVPKATLDAAPAYVLNHRDVTITVTATNGETLSKTYDIAQVLNHAQSYGAFIGQTTDKTELVSVSAETLYTIYRAVWPPKPARKSRRSR